ncbi:EamA family transporter RarD [Novosphingobium cyanobacteriorum]|uniref:EamA family transporter RarD n=1 Tax=Novosphingobium cyanobacteriorum TaxID=3024215 RepID=A0ABT6CF48_9SPHN|nr:EamA family transporter RarD [Novosphingobium cyanobacteriorum]MDF8332548.1 EamA family transporter RarD [Novosphingobium cyanobacteriorum]
MSGTNQGEAQRGGMPFALGAYLIWGFLPLYFKLLHDVPPLEVVAWRVLFTLPLCLAIVTMRGQWPEMRAIFTSPRTLARLALSAVLVAANWVIYVAAVQQGHVLAASLGYYINPLLNILLGTVFLSERLNRARWAAVAIAACGIALLLWGAVEMLALALTLAVSFALYGLVRKLTPVGAVPGLATETILLLPAAGAVAAWYGAAPAGSALMHGIGTALLLVGSGVLTAVPLLMFAVAARRLDLSTLGFVQFMSPTIAFVLGLLAFDEPLAPVKLVCFVLIWVAIALFTGDMLRRRPPR